MDKLQSLPKKDYLVPLFINAETGQLRPGTLSMGARADTYYEYLLKQWVQSGRTETRFVYVFLTCVAGWYISTNVKYFWSLVQCWFSCICRFRGWFLHSMRGVEKHLVHHSEPSHLTFIGEELASGEFYAKMVSYGFLWLKIAYGRIHSVVVYL